MDVHGEVELVADDLLVLAGKFIGTVDALGVPVCPVQAVLKHCDCKGVWEALADNSLPVPPIQVGPLDDMVLSIHPVHPVPGIVDGQPVGPEEVRIGNDASIGTIHAGVFNARCVAPICPVDGALHGVQRNCSWLLQVLPQKHLSMGAIQIGHFNPRCPRVCPIQLVMDPVNGKSTWALQPRGNHLLHIAAIEVGPHDAVQCDI